MEKLKLDLDALAVNGFETVSAAPRSAGTVRAHDDATLVTNCTLGDCTDVTSCGRPCQ
jgi:hypothetical protein